MKLVKRQINPIFIVEEEHDWKPRRPLAIQLLSILGLAIGLVALVLLVVN